MAKQTLIEIAESRPDVLDTAKAQGGDPFTAGTGANQWLNDWWNKAGKFEFPDVVLSQPPAPQIQPDSPISSETLAPTEEIDLSETPSDSAIDDSDILVSGITEQNKLATEAADKLEADKIAKEENLTSLLKEFEGEGPEQAAAEEEAGIPGFQTEQADIRGQITVLTAEYNQLKTQEEAMKTAREGTPGFTLSEISGQQAKIAREFRSRKNLVASDLTLLQAKDLALSGRILAAQNMVNRAVNLKYNGILREIETEKFQLGLISGRLNDAQQRQADAFETQLEQQKDEINEKKDVEKQIQNIMLGLAGIAPNDVLEQISQSDSVLEATKIASPYLKEEEETKETPTIKLTASERTATLRKSAITLARPELENSRGTDGYVDPKIYMQLRADYAEAIGDVSQFDNTFASMLSPKERVRLGVGKAVGLKVDEAASGACPAGTVKNPFSGECE